MRIAIDGRKIESPLTGIGRYTKNLLTHISVMDKDNEYIVIRSKDFQEKITLGENFRTVTIDYPAFSIRSLFFLHRILHHEKIDLFHSPFVSAPIFAKCKIILTVHDLIPLSFAKTFEKGKNLPWLLRKLIFRLMLLLTTKKATRIITDSIVGKKRLKGIDRSLCKKIKVIHPAAEELFGRIVNKTKIEETKAKFSSEGKLILYAGTIRPHKNLIRLIKALDLLICDKNLQCYLVIGGGKETDLLFLKKMTKKLGVSKYVFFTGGLTDSELVALMNSADVFVFPSLEEGFGLPPLEAMACGVPVIASHVSSLPEVVGDAALLVDPYDEQKIASAIQSLLLDQQLRNELVRKGFERVKLFSWKKAAIETLKVYESVAKEIRR
jgi:glycosyltransferase involved in cell wall biosynthesis